MRQPVHVLYCRICHQFSFSSSTQELSDLLKRQNLDKAGYIVRSIERFCQENGIRRKGLVANETLVDEFVAGAVSQVREF